MKAFFKAKLWKHVLFLVLVSNLWDDAAQKQWRKTRLLQSRMDSKWRPRWLFIHRKIKWPNKRRCNVLKKRLTLSPLNSIPNGTLFRPLQWKNDQMKMRGIKIDKKAFIWKKGSTAILKHCSWLFFETCTLSLGWFWNTPFHLIGALLEGSVFWFSMVIAHPYYKTSKNKLFLLNKRLFTKWWKTIQTSSGNEKQHLVVSVT